MPRLRFHYPSGITGVIIGELALLETPPRPELQPIITVTRRGRATGRDLEVGNIVALDPRAVVVDETNGGVCYHPRRVWARHSARIQTWLDEHPDWPVETLRNQAS
jgi:hypothetical protein